MKKTFLLTFFFYVSIQVFPQWTNFNTSNTKALDASLVTDIVLSGTNIIWFATDDGIVRHDITFGTWVRTNNFPNNFIYDIEIDKYNNIWVATNGGGVVELSGSTQQIYNTSNGLSNNIVRSVAIDKQGKKWFATYGGGICSYNDVSWKKYGLTDGLPTKYFYSAFCDSQGNLWFGTSGQGVVKFNGTNWQSIDKSDGLVSNTVVKIYEDSKNRIWFCCLGGVSIYDGVKYTNLTKVNGLLDDIVYCVMEDKDGNFRIGTDKGLNLWNDSSLVKFDSTNAVYDKAILVIATDQQDRYWYGHTQNGATCFDGNVWYNYGDANGLLSDLIYKAMEGRDGNLWFATSHGVSRFDGKTWKTFRSSEKYDYLDISVMDIDKDDNIWAFNDLIDRLYKFDGLSWQVIILPFSPLGYHIEEIFKDNTNNMWLVYSGYYYSDSYEYYHIVKYSDGVWTHYPILNEYVTKIFIDSKENIWIGTVEGLYKYNNNSWLNYTPSFGLGSSDIFVSDIAEDPSGNIWIGCYDYNNGGAYKFDGKSWISYADKVHTRFVESLMFDSRGCLWILGRYDLFDNNNKTIFTKYKNGKWEYLQSSDGLPFTHFYCDLIEDKDNNIWVCTSSGISKGNLALVSVDELIKSTSETIINYPNPFSTETKIKLNLEQEGKVDVEIINVNGELMRTDSYKFMNKGDNEIIINKANLKPGIYIYRIIAGEKIILNKMTVL